MKFVLKPRKYGVLDFVRIPFICEPIGTIALGTQKLLTALASVFLVIVTSNFIDTAISSVKGEADPKDVIIWLILLIICAGWRRVSFSIGMAFLDKVQINTRKQLSQAFTDKRARLSYAHIENPKTWELINRVCKVSYGLVFSMLSQSFNIMLYVVRIIGVLIIIYTKVWWVACLIGIFCIPVIFVSLSSGNKSYSAYKKASEYERRYTYLSEVLSGRDSVNERTLFEYSDYVNDKWYEQFELARKTNVSATIKWTLSSGGGGALTSILSTAIILFLVQPTISGQISIGSFIALVGGVYELIDIMGRDMTKTVFRISRSYQYMKDLTEFANLDETPDATEMPAPVCEPFESLEFRNVTFKYPGTDRYILKDLSLEIKKGIHYAFVGVNGAGKTTITKLIMGLYDNYDGQILINSKDIRTFTKPQLISFFSCVFQDFAKYHITIGQNIMIGDVRNMDTDESRDKMIKICEALDIHDAIMGLTNGYETHLGKIQDDGIDVSGGQWQRIVMARALMSPAPILILDEPTAALDPISESQLYEQFEKISKDRTTIFISHRLGSTKIADEILVMDNGKIVEKGSHEELMSMNGIYAKMYDSQRSWYE